MKYLKSTDPEMYALIKKEKRRQDTTLMMIPSENIASRAVEEATGSCLGNKYAEGYAGKRYYQGNAIVDEVEFLVTERAKVVFDVPYVNVQPHSGSPANFAVYTAVLQPGDTLSGLELGSGGHLTHGAKMNASSIYFHSQPYSVGADGYIDYDQLRSHVKKVRPKLLVCGTTAYPRLLQWERFAAIADEVGAYLLADIAHISGLVAAGVYPSPVPFVHIVTTTTHKTLRGPRGAMIMVTRKGLEKNPELGKRINSAIIPGIQGGPHMNSIAGIGVALREVQTKAYASYAKQVLKNASVLADTLTKYGFDLITGGTDSHLLLIDMRSKNLLGNTVAEAADAAGIVFNRNGIPFDPNPPFYPSGIRLGTPGVTTRGMKEKEMKIIAQGLHNIVKSLQTYKLDHTITDEQERKREVRERFINGNPVIRDVRKIVTELCARFPIPPQYI